MAQPNLNPALSTLSSIADLLGPEDGKTKKKKSNCDKPEPVQVKPDIKPIPSKLETVNVLVRPSKQPPKEQPPKQVSFCLGSKVHLLSCLSFLGGDG